MSGRSVRPRRILLVLQPLESIFLYHYFREKKIFPPELLFFYFIFFLASLLREVDALCPGHPVPGSGGGRTPKMGGPGLGAADGWKGWLAGATAGTVHRVLPAGSWARSWRLSLHFDVFRSPAGPSLRAGLWAGPLPRPAARPDTAELLRPRHPLTPLDAGIGPEAR